MMNHDEVREWKKTREEKLRSGEEALMLSLTLAMPLGKEIGSLGAKMKKAFRGKKAEKKGSTKKTSLQTVCFDKLR